MLIKIIGIGLATVFISSILKSTKPEISILINMAGSVLILCLIFPSLKDILDVCLAFADDSDLIKSMLLPVIKIVGVSFLTEFVADTLEESGNKNMANRIVFAGKIIILVMCLPIIKTLFKSLFEIL